MEDVIIEYFQKKLDNISDFESKEILSEEVSLLVAYALLYGKRQSGNTIYNISSYVNELCLDSDTSGYDDNIAYTISTALRRLDDSQLKKVGSIIKKNGYFTI